jgi:hypothetical protein
MLAHPTLEQLHALGLHGLAKGFKELETERVNDFETAGV